MSLSAFCRSENRLREVKSFAQGHTELTNGLGWNLNSSSPTTELSLPLFGFQMSVEEEWKFLMALKAVGSPAVEYKVSAVTLAGPPLGHCGGDDPNLPQQRGGRPEPSFHVAVIPGAAVPSWASTVSASKSPWRPGEMATRGPGDRPRPGLPLRDSVPKPS